MQGSCLALLLSVSLLPPQVDRLMELYFKYLDAMQAADKKIDGEKHVGTAGLCDTSHRPGTCTAPLPRQGTPLSITPLPPCSLLCSPAVGGSGLFLQVFIRV